MGFCKKVCRESPKEKNAISLLTLNTLSRFHSLQSKLDLRYPLNLNYLTLIKTGTEVECQNYKILNIVFKFDKINIFAIFLFTIYFLIRKIIQVILKTLTNLVV